MPDQVSEKFRSFDYIMKYIHSGGDPVKDTLDACRRAGKDFFISYRMNDPHYIDDLDWPTHNAFWRNHPEYWLGNTYFRDPLTHAYKRDNDKIRLFNYMIPEVRDHYFSIIKELCTNYDIDGVELDFQRFPRFFHDDKIEEGTKVMTAFVKRIKGMLDEVGRRRGKSLKLCVRVPETLAKCEKAALDVPGWDAEKLVDMINVSSYYRHTMELDIEAFKKRTNHAKIYGEMNFVTAQFNKAKDKSEKNSPQQHFRRFTTPEIYRASALNLFKRGADGLSLFNYDYIPLEKRLEMAKHLKGITDISHLEKLSTNYVVYRGFRLLPAKDEVTIPLLIPEKVEVGNCEKAILRIETRVSCEHLRIAARLNGKQLVSCEPEKVELFPPLATNAASPEFDCLKFYTVPLDWIAYGANQIEIQNLEPKKSSCLFISLELGIYKKPYPARVPNTVAASKMAFPAFHGR